MVDWDPEESRKSRERNQPSNLAVIAAFAPSDHLKLFHIGNKNGDKKYILASSRDNARIIAMLGGHIKRMDNATFWQHPWEPEFDNGLGKAIAAGIPGEIDIYRDFVITREKVFYDKRQ